MKIYIDNEKTTMSKYTYHIHDKVTAEVEEIKGSLYKAGVAAGATVPNDPSHKYIIKELFGNLSRYYNLADKSRFIVHYNGKVIERTPYGEAPQYSIWTDLQEIVDRYSEPEAQAEVAEKAFILSDHAIERLNNRFPSVSSKDLLEKLQLIDESDLKYESWDPQKNEGTAKVYIDDMRIVLGEYPTKYVVITITT